MLQALAGHPLQSRIGKVVGSHSPKIFMRHIGPGNALVIGCERDGHAFPHVDGQWMVDAAHPQNHVIAGKANFNQYVALRHFAHQAKGVVLIHQRHAVADPFRMTALDGIPNVKAQALRWYQAHGKFVGVQADVYFRIYAVQVVQHLHM